MKLIIVFVLFSFITLAQGMYEPAGSDIYKFLETLSIKGIINFDFEIQPQTRIELAKKIIELESDTTLLNLPEKTDLKYYALDYRHEINLLNSRFKEEIKSDISPVFLALNNGNKIIFFEYAGKNFSVFADPKLSISLQSIGGEQLLVRRNGFNFYGYALNNWSFSLDFYDNSETGNNLDYTKILTPQHGTSITKLKEKSFEYDNVNGSAGFYWNSGAISVSKEYLRFGNSRFGNIILYDQAPAFPAIRFDYKPVDWMRFFYFHGFLLSNVPDSSTLKYSQVPGRISINDVPKFMAFHSLSFYPSDIFSLTIGESIVYSDHIQPVYLIPVMFFRIADHYLGTNNGSATGNAQFFADASYKNASLKTKFYSSLFIDEFSFDNVFKGGNLNALAYTIGFETIDPLFDNSCLNFEYSRLNPFVYMNSVSSQNYANDSYPLGHWIGSNSDLLSVTYIQKFGRKINLLFDTWYMRKGKIEEPLEQYTLPYPEFLYGAKRFEFGIKIRLKYKPWYPVEFEAYYNFINLSDQLSKRSLDYKLREKHYFGVTASYGF